MMRPNRRATDGTCISELRKESGLSLDRQGSGIPSPSLGGTQSIRTSEPARSSARSQKARDLPSRWPSQDFQGTGWGCVHVPEVPKQEVSDLAVSQGPTQQEFGQLAVQVGLILEHLHQLQKVLEELVIPGERER